LKKFFCASLILVAALASPGGSSAADNSVMPHVFVGGTPILSAEINENFRYVNFGNIVVVDGAGAEVGSLVSLSSDETSMLVINGNGYILPLVGSRIKAVTLYYGSYNCTGEAYVKDGILPGKVWSNNGNLYYANIASRATSITANSIRNDGSAFCDSSIMPTSVPGFPVTSNDPAVTGVSSAPLSGSLKIIRRTR
jgi:hypothetical protein